MAQAIAFWVLSTVAVLAAFLVVASRNPVRSVLWLILTFFTTAGLFVMLGAEFLAMMLVVVYVGAVAVLFLFVVMMLDVDFVAMKQGFLQYMPLGALIALIMLAEIVFVGGSWVAARGADAPTGPAIPDAFENIEAIGFVLYTDYIFFFQLSGMVLLVAMIGAIVLTLRHRPGVRRQDVGAQVARTRKEAVELVDLEPGEGIG
jgi:NADH-quinone oxidoreductase subunit J